MRQYHSTPIQISQDRSDTRVVAAVSSADSVCLAVPFTASSLPRRFELYKHVQIWSEDQTGPQGTFCRRSFGSNIINSMNGGLPRGVTYLSFPAGRRGLAGPFAAGRDAAPAPGPFRRSYLSHW